MPLQKADIERFKTRLLEMKKKITHVLQGTAKEVTEPDSSKGYSQHQADEGTDDFVKSVNLELSAQEMGLIRQIDRALAKIDEGTYGICDLTQEEIPLKRLEALPYASMTVKAQEKWEKGLIT